MTTNLIIGKDINGAICDTIQVSDAIYITTLAAGVEDSIPVPPNVNVVYFSYGSSGDVWVNMSGTATIPGASFVQSTTELNPVSRYVQFGQTISVICEFDNPVEIAFYNVRTP